jgi:hypothetical protein
VIRHYVGVVVSHEILGTTAPYPRRQRHDRNIENLAQRRKKPRRPSRRSWIQPDRAAQRKRAQRLARSTRMARMSSAIMRGWLLQTLGTSAWTMQPAVGHRALPYCDHQNAHVLLPSVAFRSVVRSAIVHQLAQNR